MSVFGDNTHTKVFVSLVLIGTVLSASASVLMLFIIKRLGRWNGHILLVSTMTVFTLIYDVTFFPGIVNVGDKYITIPSNCLQLFSGVTSSLISNLVAWITYYVVKYRKSIDIFKYYYFFMFLVTFPATVDCCIFLISLKGSRYEYFADIATLEIYYYLKLFSIALNFAFVFLTSFQINRISSGKQLLSKHEKSLNALSMRLFYYPIIQSISRSGCAWYEFAYRYDSQGGGGFDLNPPHTSNTQFAAQCVMALTMPIGSVGYLIIFLMMQPKAYEELLKIFGCSPKPKEWLQFDESRVNQSDDILLLESLRNNDSMFVEHDDEFPEDEETSYTSESFLRFSIIEDEIDTTKSEYSSQLDDKASVQNQESVSNP
jgi:hypothetical protein